MSGGMQTPTTTHNYNKHFEDLPSNLVQRPYTIQELSSNFNAVPNSNASLSSAPTNRDGVNVSCNQDPHLTNPRLKELQATASISSRAPVSFGNVPNQYLASQFERRNASVMSTSYCQHLFDVYSKQIVYPYMYKYLQDSIYRTQCLNPNKSHNPKYNPNCTIRDDDVIPLSRLLGITSKQDNSQLVSRSYDQSVAPKQITSHSEPYRQPSPYNQFNFLPKESSFSKENTHLSNLFSPDRRILNTSTGIGRNISSQTKTNSVPESSEVKTLSSEVVQNRSQNAPTADRSSFSDIPALNRVQSSEHYYYDLIKQSHQNATPTVHSFNIENNGSNTSVEEESFNNTKIFDSVRNSKKKKYPSWTPFKSSFDWRPQIFLNNSHHTFITDDLLESLHSSFWSNQHQQSSDSTLNNGAIQNPTIIGIFNSNEILLTLGMKVKIEQDC